MQEKTMTRVEISGRGRRINVYELPFEVAEILRKGELSSLEFELLVDDEDLPEIFREAGIVDDLIIMVNSKRYAHSFPDLFLSEDFETEIEIGTPNNYYLVVVSTEKGDWGVIETEEEFDPGKLTLVRTRYSINNESIGILANVNYDDSCEIGDTFQKGVRCYLVYPNGNTHEVSFSD